MWSLTESTNRNSMQGWQQDKHHQQTEHEYSSIGLYGSSLVIHFMVLFWLLIFFSKVRYKSCVQYNNTMCTNYNKTKHRIVKRILCLSKVDKRISKVNISYKLLKGLTLFSS